MREKICGTIALLAFFWLLGVAGESDLGLNTIKDIIIQGGAALTIFIVSLYAGGLLEVGHAKGEDDEDRD